MGDQTQLHFIGNITADVVPEGFAQGGGVSYSGVAAHHLGADVSVYSHGPWHHDYFKRLTSHGITAHNLSPYGVSFTVFDNEYDKQGNRTQLCPEQGRKIYPEDFEGSIRLPENSICFLASVMGEITPELVAALKEKGNTLIGTVQGWLREVDENNHVFQRESKELLKVAHLFDRMIFSKEDVAGLSDDYVTKLKSLPNVVVMTRGKNGCTVIENLEGEQKTVDYPAYALTEEEDDELQRRMQGDKSVAFNAYTGLGDTYAAAFAVSESTGHSISESVMFASQIATLKILNALEGARHGIESAPTIEEYGNHIAQHAMRREEYEREIVKRAQSIETNQCGSPERR